MKIGMIDTGIDVQHRRFEGKQIESIALLEDENGDINSCYNIEDEEGHGTGIASIILQHAPVAALKAVKLNAWNRKISDRLLAAAISFLAEDKAVRIINISMGIKTNHPSPELKKACDEAAGKGIIIVAAAYYVYKEWCYPAHFNTVLGVGQGIVKTKGQFRFLENRWADILAKGGFQRVAVPGNSFRFSTGSSLATAHFTGIIAASCLEGQWTDRSSLREWLRTHSTTTVMSFTGHDEPMAVHNPADETNMSPSELFRHLSLPAGVKKVAIFPFEEKEMRTILEFTEKMSGALTFAISYPRPLKLERSISLLEEKNIPYTMQQPTEEQFNSFDTLIVGYFLDKASDHNAYFGYNLILECIKRGKHFVVWDRVAYRLIKSIAEEMATAYTGVIYLTGFNAADRTLLYKAVDDAAVRTPSLCVIGTSKKQGKFTTQMIIKELLQEEGYHVAHISTEPQGAVLGADLTFPIGHNDTVTIDLKDWNRTLRKLQLLLAEVKQPDIIITGGQGGVIPRHPVNDHDPPEKLSFVKAFYPDALICTISPNDSLAFIRKTKEVVTAFVNAHLLCYVLTPWEFSFHHENGSSVMTTRKISEEEYRERLAFYNASLGAPVFNIMDISNRPALLRIILQYFSTNKIDEHHEYTR
jgi:uncharacterized NAD-dependent epimerase/dehydratase family protein